MVPESKETCVQGLSSTIMVLLAEVACIRQLRSGKMNCDPLWADFLDNTLKCSKLRRNTSGSICMTEETGRESLEETVTNGGRGGGFNALKPAREWPSSISHWTECLTCCARMPADWAASAAQSNCKS